PHAIDAERAVLGGLMIDPAAWDKIADQVVSEDFYRKDHRHVFEAIADLNERDQPSDALTVIEWFQSHDELDSIGGLAFVTGLSNEVSSAANIKAYAGIIKEKSALRQLIDVGTTITDSAFEPKGREAKELIEQAEMGVFRIAEQSSRGKGGFRSVKKALAGAVERLHELYETDETITGITSGFTDFDKMTAGLQKGDLIIVAGRPSMGKTTLAMNMAETAAIKAKVGVAVFSMEMGDEQLAVRLISSLGRINQGNLRTGNLHDDEWPRVTSAVSMLSETEIYIDETPALSPSDLRSRARRLARETNLGLIVVDYLQLMQLPGSTENRAQEISEISRSLKALARELDVPVIALSQLNRSVEQRPNKRPMMSDLRESGSIEQDADLIVFIYRDEVYNKETQYKGLAEIIIGKQRNGETGTVKLTFQGQFTRFDNYVAGAYDDAEY
ncbi:MAG: replicative DNA helicase, partial [bacterium]